ncbi:hypothetical protein MPTK1_7g04960 [Marchantia polymorpha subsp. ruderalis]|uniref:Uncharacterized protein n=2 Tax=Marchantia polymorpha TaxID=3197 RepID=A0AAF6BW94_MARPO|nr:hypothetical protein MARPO_0062s0030 [Marchantia polymorpha]BBN16278.1 hypothetical protein Mp_7g04960 [Marchantia polymorpha subsp. ruderalis]|eukprot:PTQ36604.1 hypothetical protein MARPO_0062s0030 [Marchantia polymorpha]
MFRCYSQEAHGSSFTCRHGEENSVEFSKQQDESSELNLQEVGEWKQSSPSSLSLFSRSPSIKRSHFSWPRF